jgi:homopolymeric O-antigen transport system ATP-binding protein
MNAAISVNGLGKRYILGSRRPATDGLRHVVEAAVRAPARWLRQNGREAAAKRKREEFWALQDVSFSIDRGEAVGVIGRNGAGKSTLLKILSRITEPTLGEIRYKGRLASLLEVGTGFHPELTGRENIYLNAAILGMKRAEITRRFDEIVAFAEVEKFLDTPVKRYSSGMYVRLAFGVAAHLEPDILLVDEVLAVGDAAFQRKCLGRMGDVVQEGRTVLFVSHNMAAIAALCTRAMLIHGGRLVHSDRPQAVIDQYLQTVRSDASAALSDRDDRQGAGRVRFTTVELLGCRGEPAEIVRSGEDVAFQLNYELAAPKDLHNAVVQIKFAGNLGQSLFACLSNAASSEPLVLTPGGRLICRIPRLPLAAGIYTYTVWCSVGGVLEDFVRDAGTLSVTEGDFFGTGRLPPNNLGEFLVAHTWEAS